MANDDDTYRRRITKEIADLINQHFPDAIFSDAVAALLEHYTTRSVDSIACAQTELWIKTNRLEEVISLLSLTNMDIADLYRRQVGNELRFLRESSISLAEAVSAHHAGIPSKK